MGNPMPVFDDDADGAHRGKKPKTGGAGVAAHSGPEATLRGTAVSPAMRRLLNRANAATNNAAAQPRAAPSPIVFGTLRPDDSAPASPNTDAWDADLDAVFLGSLTTADTPAPSTATVFADPELERRRLRVLRRLQTTTVSTQPEASPPHSRRRELVSRALERMVFDRLARASQSGEAASATIRSAENVIATDGLRGPRSFPSGELNAPERTTFVGRGLEAEAAGEDPPLSGRLRDQAAQLDRSLGQIARLFDALARVRRELGVSEDGELSQEPTTPAATNLPFIAFGDATSVYPAASASSTGGINAAADLPNLRDLTLARRLEGVERYVRRSQELSTPESASTNAESNPSPTEGSRSDGSAAVEGSLR